jgi:FkbM family methyltransferase
MDKVRRYIQEHGLKEFVSFAASKVLNEKVGIQLPRPYEFVQLDTVRNLHRYLGITPFDVRHIVIVGAHMAYEVDDLRVRFPRCRFTLFEASPRYIDKLKNRFAAIGSVDIHEMAISDEAGTLTFYETNLEGSGSIQKLGELAQVSYGAREAEAYTVQSTTLDTHFASVGVGPIDCLWIDVQGAEERVLRGAKATLANVRSVFIEVSVHGPLYAGGATYAGLCDFLAGFKFVPVSLGTDFRDGTGNAFLITRP